MRPRVGFIRTATDKSDPEPMSQRRASDARTCVRPDVAGLSSAVKAMAGSIGQVWQLWAIEPVPTSYSALSESFWSLATTDESEGPATSCPIIPVISSTARCAGACGLHAIMAACRRPSR